ncbi:glycosyltransferase [Microbacterium enclense]|uniref:glycosyltransferase n=1 Tax=Microbacterium enclense TaxID=993073 RepID=UPI00203F525C|nr:glycosyltransferase [Microbacterium enclense]MCM3615290.1 glycosyltransferase [Microbacterium enclense]
MPVSSPPRVIGATVTYGSRAASCLATVGAMRAAGVETVVVVDNGSVDDARRQLDAYARAHAPVVRYHRLARNEGSAPAFGFAIERALESDADYLWLLDDDNLPHGDALAILLAEEQAMRAAGIDLCAVAPTRAPSGDPREIAAVRRAEQAREQPREDRSFAGVEFALFARRALERLGLRRPRISRDAAVVTYAPYGGLLVRLDVLRRIGLPDADLVLYGDDLEYTSRIVRAGGCIRLSAEAVVVDPRGERWMPPGFEVLAMFRSTDDALLYYSMRNRIHRELRTGRRHSLARWTNAGLFWALCLVCLAVTRRPQKLRVLGRAAADAWAGRLGRRVELAG